MLDEDQRAEALALLLRRPPTCLPKTRRSLRRRRHRRRTDQQVLAAYLAATSRLLARPLAVIIQSTSAAGKTTSWKRCSRSSPSEEQIKYSAMTGQSLYYLGESNLRHKILAIVEEEGAEKASYALKLLAIRRRTDHRQHRQGRAPPAA